MHHRNRYYLMRHGQSEANVAGKINSHPDSGCTHFGLTDEGKQQVVDSLANYTGHAIHRVYCSDFLRTQQTARLVTESLGLPSPIDEPLLRERYFGDWDGLSDCHYERVWQQDATAPHKPSGQVESSAQVFTRAMSVIERLERQHLDETILLVAHGDVLQILRTVWFNLAPHEHRSLPSIHTAEIITLNDKRYS